MNKNNGKKACIVGAGIAGLVTAKVFKEVGFEVTAVRHWAKAQFDQFEQGYFIGPFIAHYTDELMRDMGYATHRADNPFTEYFGRFLPRRYKGAFKRRAINNCR